MALSDNTKSLWRYILVAICSSIVTFFTASCTAGIVVGKNLRQQQENNITTKSDSSYFIPSITIR